MNRFAKKSLLTALSFITSHTVYTQKSSMTQSLNMLLPKFWGKKKTLQIYNYLS